MSNKSPVFSGSFVTSINISGPTSGPVVKENHTVLSSSKIPKSAVSILSSSLEQTLLYAPMELSPMIVPALTTPKSIALQIKLLLISSLTAISKLTVPPEERLLGKERENASVVPAIGTLKS